MAILSALIAVAALFAPLVPPTSASAIVASWMDAPWIEVELLRTCQRESRCRHHGPHAIDAKWHATMWHRAVKSGWLDPATCEHHAESRGPWHPTGSFGTSPAYLGRWMPWSCAPAQLMAIPLFGAWASAQHMDIHCGYLPAKQRQGCVRELWSGKATARGRTRAILALKRSRNVF